MVDKASSLHGLTPWWKKCLPSECWTAEKGGDKEASTNDAKKTVQMKEEISPSFFSEEIVIPIWAIAVIAIVGFCVVSLCIWFQCRQWKKRKEKKYDILQVDKNAVGIQVDINSPCKIATIGDSFTTAYSPQISQDDTDDAVSQSDRPRLKYRLDYDFNSNSLSVTVIQAEDLPALDSGGSSDPYCKVYLLPDRKKKFTTQVVQKSLNPYFNETFIFKNIPYTQLRTKTLVFALYDYDRFSRNDAMGEIKVPLCQVDLADSKERWGEIHQPVESTPEKDCKLGELCFSLRYIPTSGKLTVVIIEARNLKKMDIGGLSDPYVKISLMLNGKRVKKKKTATKKCTLNPYYNESFTFDVPFEDIKKAELVLTVIDYDRIGASEPIGQVTMGHNATGSELCHWSDMLATPRHAVSKWHTLNEIGSDSRY
ncbi:synaptotagmin 1 [Anabrus simplex]|uniref:synaptotagmin 1 n=1 Tax=Anabrus simplex TaxID=316456 RepID=UPI0035A30CAB